MNLVIKTDSHQNNLLKHVTEKRTKKKHADIPETSPKTFPQWLIILGPEIHDKMSSQCVSPPSKTLRNLISYNSLISALMMSCPCFCVFPGWRDCHNIMAIHVYVNSRIIVCIYTYIYSYITRKKTVGMECFAICLCLLTCLPHFGDLPDGCSSSTQAEENWSVVPLGLVFSNVWRCQ